MDLTTSIFLSGCFSLLVTSVHVYKVLKMRVDRPRVDWMAHPSHLTMPRIVVDPMTQILPSKHFIVHYDSTNMTQLCQYSALATQYNNDQSGSPLETKAGSHIGDPSWFTKWRSKVCHATVIHAGLHKAGHTVVIHVGSHTGDPRRVTRCHW